jgi:DNA-binding NarL/FixJ family response regulator
LGEESVFHARVGARRSTFAFEQEPGRETAFSDASLTAFERHVLQLFASGLPRGEIARALNRAPKTISNSLTAAKDKLGARSLAEAAVLLTAGLLTNVQ